MDSAYFGNESTKEKVTIMKKVVFCIALILLISAFFCAWYVQPVKFLDNASSDGVSRILVFDGQSGEKSTVTDKDEIASAVSKLQGTVFKRSGISLGKMGYRYKLTFYDNEENVIESFIVNSESVLRKDPFFYEAIGR